MITHTHTHTHTHTYKLITEMKAEARNGKQMSNSIQRNLDKLTIFISGFQAREVSSKIA